MEAVSVHVVWEPARTADARDEHYFLLGYAELRHHFLNLSQDRVIAAAGTPAHLLVGLKILARQFDGRVPVRSFRCVSVCMYTLAHLNHLYIYCSLRDTL